MSIEKGKSRPNLNSSLPSSAEPASQKGFDPASALANSGIATSSLAFSAKDVIFWQGSPADSVFLIHEGRVKLTVVSAEGKEATLAFLGADEFLGEHSMAEQQHVWMNTATAATDCVLLKIGRNDMAAMLRREPRFANFFLSFLLARNLRMQEAVVDQVFNSSEKRLARTLLLLANFRGPEEVQTVVPKINHETLAAMVGTTRARVSFFMNRFRKQGFIDYRPDNRGVLKVHRSLVNALADAEVCAQCSQRDPQRSDCIRCCTSVPLGMGREDNL